MITVLPEKDKSLIKELYEKSGAAFCENSECVIARDGEEVLGYCLVPELLALSHGGRICLPPAVVADVVLEGHPDLEAP